MQLTCSVCSCVFMRIKKVGISMPKSQIPWELQPLGPHSVLCLCMLINVSYFCLSSLYIFLGVFFIMRLSSLFSIQQYNILSLEKMYMRCPCGMLIITAARNAVVRVSQMSAIGYVYDVVSGEEHNCPSSSCLFCQTWSRVLRILIAQRGCVPPLVLHPLQDEEQKRVSSGCPAASLSPPSIVQG